MSFGHHRIDSRRILLREIAARGRIPRIDLAQRTGISRATVTSVTAELLRDGLIAEIAPEAAPGRGRPKVDLKLRAGAHLVAGVKISAAWISVLLMDFEGAERGGARVELPPGQHSPDALAGYVTGAVMQVLAQHGLDRSDLSAVGVGIAGIVDAPAGHVHWSPSLTLRNVDLWKPLGAQLGVPAYIDNDANLVAVAERRFGLGRQHDNFIVVTIEAGVGMGLFLDGQLYRGTRGCGAEFGHTKVQLDGALCRCGQRGCLEAYVADYALEREAQTVLGPGHTGIEGLVAAAQHDRAAASIIKRAGKMFALGLANLVNIFDPSLIILAGEQVRFQRLSARDVLAEMRKSIVQVDTPPPKVVIHAQGDEMWARGAAAYALDFVMDDAARTAGDAV
ncbi:MAG: ROK family transcriptional regulator [Pseudomonadota bacterium]